MRIRLRAPDESEPAAAASPLPPVHPSSRPSSAQASPRTPSRLPQLDVRSPDFIEQRLENLKRKQSWLSYLDQYVKDHPEDDDDNQQEASRTKGAGAVNVDTIDAENEDDNNGTDEEDNQPGFFKSLVCAIAVVVLTPMWVVLFPVLRNKGPEFWPLGSTSLWHLYKRSLSLLAFVVLGVELLYYIICRELPEWSRDTWFVLQVEFEDMLDATTSCRAAVSRANDVLIRELCAPIVIDVIVLQLIAWVTLQTHRRWGRVLLVAIAVLVYVDTPGKINMAIQPLPEITGIDQPYALVDEEILVAFDGKNLQPGGTIAWVSYWGCASTAPVATCDLQFPALFDMGYAAVTFSTIDHFIPCYRNPPNPLKAEDFRCFEHIRLPVKGKQSIPGWSKTASSSSLQPARGANSYATLAHETAQKYKSERKGSRSKAHPMRTAAVDPAGGETAIER